MESDLPFNGAASLSESVPDSTGINIPPWIAILIYGILICLPFIISSGRNLCNGVGVTLAKYVTRHSTRILLYHSGLTLLLVIYLFLTANGGLHLERDLGYYTAVSTKSNEVNML